MCVSVLITFCWPKTPYHFKTFRWLYLLQSTNIQYIEVIQNKKLTRGPHIPSKLQQSYQSLKIPYYFINRQTSYLSWNVLLNNQIPVWDNHAKPHIKKNDVHMEPSTSSCLWLINIHIYVLLVNFLDQTKLNSKFCSTLNFKNKIFFVLQFCASISFRFFVMIQTEISNVPILLVRIIQLYIGIWIS